MRNKLFLLTLLLIGGLFANAQTKDELQKKESDLKKEITDLTNSLTQIQKNKKLSLSQVASVQRKIAAREELINTISKQVKMLDETIYQNELEIYRMRKELDTLKLKYAQSIVFAYKNRSSYQYLNFLFSATSFNDALKRVTYLKSYRQLRETQVDNIIKTQSVLAQKQGTLTASKDEQGHVLQNQKGELVNFEEDKKKLNEVAKDLKSQEKEVSTQIRNKEKQRQQMKTAIAAVIKREIAAENARIKAAEEAERQRIARIKAEKDAEAKKSQTAKVNDGTPKNPTPVKPKITAGGDKPMPNIGNNSDRVYSPLESTAEGVEVSKRFELRNLPWPVNTGNVTGNFGTSLIPGTIITRVLDGIEISLPEGSAVKCVADGTVSTIFDLGGELTITVRHGKYFTTYSHLASTSVSKGMAVKSGTVLGKSGTDEGGEGSLLFMVTNDKGVFLNPKGWLKAR